MPRRNSSRILLNDYGNAAAAYSFRRLRSGYSGFAARVRRSTDNVEIDVPFNSDAGLGTANVEQFLQSCTGGFGRNLLLYSEEFNNTSWITEGATVTANTSVSPIGTQTADRVTANVTNSFVRRPFTAVANNTYVFSIYVIQSTSPVQLDIKLVDSGGNAIYGSTTFTTSNTWQRVSVSASIPITAPQVLIGGSSSFSTGEEIIIWGAQVELGSTPTAYDYKGADTTAASAFVTTWYDQSGNGRDATQATAANQPRVVNVGVVDKVNGRVSVRFDSGKYFVSTQSVFSLGAGVYSVFLTAESTNTSQCVFFSGGNATKNQAVGGALQLGVERHFWFSNDLDSVVSASTNFAQRSYFYTGVSRSTYRNSVLIAQDNPTGKNTGSGVLYIGALASNLNFNVIGQYPELVIYNIDQSASRTTIESNITQTYFGAPRLLNRFPNAAVAYSTRKLDRFYSGSALRVRRSNDNAELDIGFDANGDLNESALLAFVGTNSAFVTTWYDQSGNARNATQATAANQPRIVNAGVVDKVNGRVAPVVTATDTQVLKASGFTLPQPVTAFGAATLPLAATLFDSNDSATAFSIYRITGTGNAVLEATLSLTDGIASGFRSYYGLFNSTSSEVATNGQTAVVGNGGNSSLIGVSLFGNRLATTKSVIGTQTSEVILYPSNQSTNRTLIEQDIISYFGVV